MRRVALVGGAGFIGHNLAIRLSEKYDVHVIDNLMWNNMVDNMTGDIDDFRRQLYHRFIMQRFDKMRIAGVTFHNFDARNDMSTLLMQICPDDIVHLSAISSALKAKDNPGLCFDLQLVTLRNVLEYASVADIRVTFMSSSTVYGDFVDEVVTESTRPRPKGIYANAKYMGERLVRTYSHEYGLNSIIIRPSALYGPRCISGRVSQKFIEKALRGDALTLDGGGTGMLDFTHVDDLCDGIALALEYAPKGTNTYNITRGNARSIAKLAHIVNEIIECNLVSTPPNPNAPIRGTLSVNRAKGELGFEPKHDLENGYANYVREYRNHWYAVQEDYCRPDPKLRDINPDQAVQA